MNANSASLVPRSGTYRFNILEKSEAVGIVQHVLPDGTVWGTRGREIFCKRGGGTWQVAGSFPRVLPRDLFETSRLWARASRSDKSNLFVNSAGNVLAIRSGTAYRFINGNLRKLGSIRGDSVLPGGIAEDNAGWAYFGEYFLNRKRGPVRLWRASPDLERCEIAHEFSSGGVRHIHGVFRDPYDNQALWLTVGDFAGECHFIRSRDRFQTIDQFGDGTQTWRAVSIFFTESHICWITDSEVQQNRACRMDRASGKLELGQCVDNPVWFGTELRDGLKIAFTTVEGSAATHRQQSSILLSSDGFHWEEVSSFEKDRLRPLRLLKFGVISCPAGAMDSADFWISGEGLIGLDGISLRCALERLK